MCCGALCRRIRSAWMRRGCFVLIEEIIVSLSFFLFSLSLLASLLSRSFPSPSSLHLISSSSSPPSRSSTFLLLLDQKKIYQTKITSGFCCNLAGVLTSMMMGKERTMTAVRFPLPLPFPFPFPYPPSFLFNSCSHPLFISAPSLY